ncbi:MAG TPA: hypothetical protein VF929_08750 [Gemmatimonadaceae bacterium]
MTEGQDTRDAADAMGDARMRLHRALLQSHRLRGSFDELDDAASSFCLLLKQLGYSPEQTLIDAKKVIDDALEGHDIPTAERAVLMCIQQYYK